MTYHDFRKKNTSYVNFQPFVLFVLTINFLKLENILHDSMLFCFFQIDDQISLLINSWCELLLFSCCFRSMASPGEIRVSLGKSISLSKAKDLGLGPCIERMLNFTQHLRRLRLDKYEYVAMKVS